MKVLATAKSLERIVKYINEYWFDQHELRQDGKGSWSISGCQGTKENHNVVPFRGGYKFQRLN